MNKHKFIKIFLVGILLSTLTGTKPSAGELKVRGSDRAPQRIRDRKLLKKTTDFLPAKNITHQVIDSKIITRFAPRDRSGKRIAIDKLASDLGYDHFNWVNYVERDPYGISDRAGRLLSTPYNDPPKGGYAYDSADSLPFYWDLMQCDRCKPRHHRKHSNNLKQDELVFHDFPADYRLQPGEAVEFATSLVGVKKYDVVNLTAEWEVLYTFRWQLTNPTPRRGQTSLVETDVELNNLSPVLRNAMRLDGATLSHYVNGLGH